MERLTKSRLFAWLVYIIMGLLALYLLLLVKPIFIHLYVFLRSILAPFIIAMIVSYVLNPVVTMLHQRKVPRTAAVLLIYAVFCAALAVILVNVIPMFKEQMDELNRHVPDLTYRAESLVTDLNNTSFLPDSIRDGMNKSIYQMEKKLSDTVSHFINNIGSVVNAVFIAFIIPFLAFLYFEGFRFVRADGYYLRSEVAPQARRQAPQGY